MGCSCERKECQSDSVIAATGRYPRTLYMVQRARFHGFRGTLGRFWAKVRSRRTQLPPCDQGTAAPGPAVLDLQAGEMVEVRPWSEIAATLDASGRTKGLLFMPEMVAFCGSRFRVFKRVERILIETTGEMRRMKNTVLLESALCDGWQGACHRSCFYFWREAWLKRVEE